MKEYRIFSIIGLLTILSSIHIHAGEVTKDGRSAQQSKLSNSFPKSKHELSFDFGYGHILYKKSGLSENNLKFRDATTNGVSINLQYNFFFKPNWGVGAMYSRYITSWGGMYDYQPNKKIEKFEKTSFATTYTGLFASARLFIGKKWIAKADAGLGLLYHNAQIEFELPNCKVAGNCNIGIEYQLSRHLGVGAKIQTILSDFKKLEISENGFTNTSRLENNIMLGNRIDFLVGIRYYIK